MSENSVVKLEPKGIWCVVKPDPISEENQGGIIIPETVKKEHKSGVVVAVGDGKDNGRIKLPSGRKMFPNGGHYPIDIVAGDKVLYRHVAALGFFHNNENVDLIDTYDILAVIG